MLTHIRNFIAHEEGAITVDWVVLTAAIVGMGVLVITTVARGATDQSSGLNDHLLNKSVTTSY